MADRLELRQPISPRRDADVEARSSAAGSPGAGDQEAEQNPGRGQAKIETTAPAPGFPKGVRHKGPVVEEHHEGRRRHHLLGRHAEKAGQE